MVNHQITVAKLSYSLQVLAVLIFSAARNCKKTQHIYKQHEDQLVVAHTDTFERNIIVEDQIFLKTQEELCRSSSSAGLENNVA